MDYKDKIKVPVFSGPLKEILTQFLEEMRLSGRLYNTEAYYLSQIDKAAIETETLPNVLSKEFVELYITKREYESDKTWKNRIVIIRRFGKYMHSHGFQAYIAPILSSNKPSDFVPHIYTDNELHNLFEQSDLLPYRPWSPNRTHVASLLFRMLYGCGLRLSEALRLTMKDVDTENGVLSVINSKFNVSRFVPMSSALNERCRLYIKEVRYLAALEDPFFPRPDGRHYSCKGANEIFRQILFKAGIPHTSKGPRIHDLRHTFAVNCFKTWIREGKDLTSMLPILSAYMGHKNLSSTQYYLRLTADMFPDIINTLEKHFGDIVPKGGPTDEKN